MFPMTNSISLDRSTHFDQCMKACIGKKFYKLHLLQVQTVSLILEKTNFIDQNINSIQFKLEKNSSNLVAI